jgi:hypothetical protein
MMRDENKMKLYVFQKRETSADLGRICEFMMVSNNQDYTWKSISEMNDVVSINICRSRECLFESCVT